DMYREFGRDQAYSVCESAYSYAVKLDDGLRCLMLNNNFRDIDSMHDASPTYSPECFRWIRETVEQARSEGAYVFACTHHPLVPPVPAYKIGGTPRNMRSSYVCHTLADIGLELVFSGHTHFSNVAFGSSDFGNVICNVTTPSICFLPPEYRIAELDAGEKRLTLTTVPVQKTSEMDFEEPTVREHLINEFISDQREKLISKPYGEKLLSLRVKHLYPLCRKAAGLNQAEYQSICEKPIFDIIMDAAVNMQTGDGRYTPDTPICRFMLALCDVLDSVVRVQPFYPIEKKLLGYSLRQIVEPMMYKNDVPDNDCSFVFNVMPDKKYDPPVYPSHAGEIVIAVLSAAAAMLSPLAPIASALAIPALTVLKRKKTKNNPYSPERY
nr:hypothetical protein [Clostridia bacterium]